MAYGARALNLLFQTAVCDATGAPTSRVVRTWFYATDDAAATVEAANYFNAGYQRFNKGDVIIASMVNGGTPILKKYIVTSASQATTVVIALQTTTAG